MNPYQPPLAKDEVPPGEQPLMQVYYGRAYTWFLAAAAVAVAIPNLYGLFASSSGFGPALLLLPLSLLLLCLAMLSRRAVFFEVFEDRLEFLSLVLKWRRVRRPLQLRIPRWMANHEDLKRFEAWRQGRGTSSLSIE